MESDGYLDELIWQVLVFALVGLAAILAVWLAKRYRRWLARRLVPQPKWAGVSAWGGRNNYPIWQQTELFWDEDVTPTGLAGTYSAPLGIGKLNTTMGAFYLPDGANGLNGTMLSAGADYSTSGESGKLRIGASLNMLRGESGATYL